MAVSDTYCIVQVTTDDNGVWGVFGPFATAEAAANIEKLRSGESDIYVEYHLRRLAPLSENIFGKIL